MAATADDRVGSIRNRGLGGKQIWLLDDLISSSHHYVHLDSQLVRSGQRVKRVDAIGLVGNTGNVRTTAPHLHFGIYKSGGAVDPRPYIWQVPVPENGVSLPISMIALDSGSGANLHVEPDATSILLRKVQNDKLSILGNSIDWYYVRTTDSLAGFAHKSMVDGLKTKPYSTSIITGQWSLCTALLKITDRFTLSIKGDVTM